MARKRAAADAVEAVPGVTPSKARNAVKVAKVVLPAVLPVIAPYASQATGYARDGLDRLRARRIGVAVENLGEYTGRGAALHARINGARTGLNDLAAAKQDDPAFTTRSADTLDKLAAAVRAAERMPAPRRRAAHRAVSTQLDGIEKELLSRLGLPRAEA